MSSELIISQSPGNTPIKKIPRDYFPEGCGFWFIIPEGLDANKKMFFRDSKHGSDNPENTILFVHGNPENSYTYRKVIMHIIEQVKKPYRLVAIDHIGFGLSDQATYEMVCMDHASNLIQMVKYLDLRNITLVIHDWGGPIGIGALLKEPERLKNLVILNTTVFPLPPSGITYKNFPGKWLYWARGPKIIPNRFWGAFAAFAIFAKPMKITKLFIKMFFSILTNTIGIFKKNERVAQKLFKRQFKSKLNVLSSKRLVLQTPMWGYGNNYFEPQLGNRDTSDFYQFIQDNISNLWGVNGQNVGVRLLCGKWDPLAKNEVIKQWLINLPQIASHVKIFEKIGHFIEEIKPKEIANDIITVAGLV
ncbi:MAG: alpha/beta fold hydrolase [Candidatus Hermodarchaeota archaeon]